MSLDSEIKKAELASKKHEDYLQKLYKRKRSEDLNKDDTPSKLYKLKQAKEISDNDISYEDALMCHQALINFREELHTLRKCKLRSKILGNNQSLIDYTRKHLNRFQDSAVPNHVNPIYVSNNTKVLKDLNDLSKEMSLLKEETAKHINALMV